MIRAVEHDQQDRDAVHPQDVVDVVGRDPGELLAELEDGGLRVEVEVRGPARPRASAMLATRAVTLILVSPFRNSSTSAPASGRKITVERMGNPKGFMVKYDGIMVSIP